MSQKMKRYKGLHYSYADDSSLGREKLWVTYLIEP